MDVNPRNVKKAKFIKAVLSGEGLRDSAIAAGYAPGGAAQAGSKLIRRPDIQEAIQKALDSEGVTVSRCAAEVRKGLEFGKKGSHSDYLNIALKLHGLNRQESTGPDVQMSKDSFRDLCQAFWQTGRELGRV